MNFARQLEPIATSYSQLQPLGLDVGNGATKFVTNDREIIIPSYIHPLHDLGATDPELGLIEYLGGDRGDLVGAKWFAGKAAAQVAPITCQRVVDDAKGKIKFALQLLTGAIETLPHQLRWKFAVVLSSQDSQTFGDELADAVAGVHSFRFRGTDVTQIEIDVLAVVEEGIGAIAVASADIDIKGTVIVNDLGNGTLIASVFQSGKLIDRKVILRGVEPLITEIANHRDTRKQLNNPARKDLIRAGIENRTFDYGNVAVTGFNFEPIYLAELKEWIVSGLAQLLKATAEWSAGADASIAIGGGAQLPKITPLLVAKGITPISDSHWANARGLFKLAQLKLHKGGAKA